MSAWTTNVSVLLMSRNSGKSLLAAIYLFLRCTLFPKQQCYIIASSSAQANETFDKLHKLCTGGIKTMSYRWELMALEIKKSQGSDGFNNFGEGKKCEFNNGSQVFSLPGNPDTIRGKRADLVIYDEASFISNEMFRSTKAFTAQDSNFKTAKKDVDISVHPLLLPKQQIFLSSAGNVDSEMYRQYSYCTRQMLAGSKEYFVCDFDYQIPANPTLDGKEYPPLLDQKTIDSERANAYNFEHEFMNLFVETGTDDAVVSRDVIMRNEIEYKPTLYSENEKNVIYGIFHDSARS